MKGILYFFASVIAILGIFAGLIILLIAPSEIASRLDHQIAIFTGWQIIGASLFTSLFIGGQGAILDRLDAIQASVRQQAPKEERNHMGVSYRFSAREENGLWAGCYALCTQKGDIRLQPLPSLSAALELANASAMKAIEGSKG